MVRPTSSSSGQNVITGTTEGKGREGTNGFPKSNPAPSLALPVHPLAIPSAHSNPFPPSPSARPW